MTRPPLIAVIGGRRVEKALLREAERVGGMVAQRGAVLLCGGLGGVMEAASRGAKEAGGLIIGILPQDHDRDANPHLSIPIITGMGIGRNVIIARTADAVIAVGGEYGTLSEIAFSLQLQKPVVGIRTWDIKGIEPASDASEAVEKVFRMISADR